MGRKSREKRERRERAEAGGVRRQPMTRELAVLYESYRELLQQLRAYVERTLAEQNVIGCSVCGRMSQSREEMLAIGLLDSVPRPACPDCWPRLAYPLEGQGFPFVFPRAPADDLGRWYAALPEEAVPVVHRDGEIQAHMPAQTDGRTRATTTE